MTFEQFNSRANTHPTSDASSALYGELIATNPREPHGERPGGSTPPTRVEVNPTTNVEVNPRNTNLNHNQVEVNPRNTNLNHNQVETRANAVGTGGDARSNSTAVGTGGDGGDGGNSSVRYEDNSVSKDQSIFWAPSWDSTQGIPPGTEGASLKVTLPTGQVDYSIYAPQSSEATNVGGGLVVPGSFGAHFNFGTASTGDAPPEIREGVVEVRQRAGTALDHILSKDK